MSRADVAHPAHSTLAMTPRVIFGAGSHVRPAVPTLQHAGAQAGTARRECFRSIRAETR